MVVLCRKREDSTQTDANTATKKATTTSTFSTHGPCRRRKGVIKKQNTGTVHKRTLSKQTRLHVNEKPHAPPCPHAISNNKEMHGTASVGE